MLLTRCSTVYAPPTHDIILHKLHSNDHARFDYVCYPDNALRTAPETAEQQHYLCCKFTHQCNIGYCVAGICSNLP